MWLVVVSRAIKVVVDLLCKRYRFILVSVTIHTDLHLSLPNRSEPLEEARAATVHHSVFYAPLQSGREEKQRRDSLLLSSLSTLV
jgi:hypothetical protein